MSHIVIKLYSFECDADGCNQVVEAIPGHRGERLLNESRRIIVQEEGWTVRDGCEFCPKHSAQK